MKLGAADKQARELRSDRLLFICVERPESMSLAAWGEFVCEAPAGVISSLEEYWRLGPSPGPEDENGPR